MQSKEVNKFVLAISICYMLIAISCITKNITFSFKFYLIISICSVIISFYQLIRSITNSYCKINNLYIEKINKHNKNSDKYIINEVEKISLKNKIIDFIFGVYELSTFIAFFMTLILIPFLEINEMKSNKISCLLTIIGFSLMFLTVYIDNNCKMEENTITNRISNLEKKFKK